MSLDVIVPEVTALHQKARFYRDGEKTLVEISYVGDNGTVIRKVTPEHMATYRDAWNAFCDGEPLKRRTGTPLTDIPGLNSELEEKYVTSNVHTAEEFAALSDSQCSSLGHGTLTLRTAARDMLGIRKHKEMEDVAKRISVAAKTVSAMPSDADEKYASKDDVNELKSMMAQLLATNAPKKSRVGVPQVGKKAKG